jgi:hypothetical protein
MTLVWTFSGTHEFRSTCLADADAHEQGVADQIVADIDDGRCPRCRRPLTTKPGHLAAGSRVTRCRCIPICSTCGSDEANETVDGMRGIGSGLSAAGHWPIPVEELEGRHARHNQRTEVAIFGVENGSLIGEHGSIPVINTCDTGGWAQYGYDKEG